MVPEGGHSRGPVDLQGRDGRRRAGRRRAAARRVRQRRADRREAAAHGSGARSRRGHRRGPAHAARRDRADRRPPLDRRISSSRRGESAGSVLERSPNACRIESPPRSHRSFPHESRRRRTRRSRTQPPGCGITRTRWRPTASMSIWSASKARRCRAPWPTSRGSPCTGSHRPCSGAAKALTGFAYTFAALLDAARLSFRLWRTAAGLETARTWSSSRTRRSSRRSRSRGARFAAAASASSSTGTTSGIRCCSCRLGRWHPAVRLARWFERRDARRVDGHLCVSRALAAFLESRFGVHDARVLYDRPAAAFVPIERAEREQFRQALFTRLGSRGAVVGFIVCPTSWTEDEDFDVAIDAVRMLEERIRGWEAAQSDAPLSGSRHPRDGRRRQARGVRAPLCGIAGAPGPAARSMARARGLSARRRQRGSRAVPPPFLVRPRHSDEGGRSVRRRRAGVRARLRRVPR